MYIHLGQMYIVECKCVFLVGKSIKRERTMEKGMRITVMDDNLKFNFIIFPAHSFMRQKLPKYKKKKLKINFFYL